MTADEPLEISELQRHIARLGLPLVDAPADPPEAALTSFGHPLPAAYVWFCRHCPKHNGFPFHDWGEAQRTPKRLSARRRREPKPDPRRALNLPPYSFGLLSPLGDPSPLQSYNALLRQDQPRWPSKWVSFCHGGDEDFCFSYEPDGSVWVAYWHYNAGEQFLPHQFDDDYHATGFVEWFGRMVDEVLERKARSAGR